jgi:hypothetical protein
MPHCCTTAPGAENPGSTATGLAPVSGFHSCHHGMSRSGIEAGGCESLQHSVDTVLGYAATAGIPA